MREGDRTTRREVITLLTPQLTTHVVRLLNDNPISSSRAPISQEAQAHMATLGPERVKFLSSHCYSIMVKKSLSYGFGTTIPVAPGVWLVAKHVVEPFNQYRVEIPSNLHDEGTWDTRASLTPLASFSYEDQHYLNFLVRNEEEPLYGLPQINVEFTEYLNLTLMSGPVVDPLFPSIAPLNVGDPVAAFGLNGVPVYSVMSDTLDKVYGNSPLKPSVKTANDMFHMIGSKGVSFGNVMATRAGLLTHSCSLLNGAAGCFLKKVSEDGSTFVGIHTGGNFNTNTSVAYNYGYHTSHIGLILIYAKFIYPIFKAHGAIPDSLVTYLRHHKTTIEQHRNFVVNDIFTTILA